MSTSESIEEAVETLRWFGLREYESKCLIGLMRLSTGTAKEVSELTDVPRTRVYDAVRVLEARGLITIQYSSPKRFRPVTPEEVVRTFHERYERELERLSTSLNAVAGVEDTARMPGVRTLTGRDRIDDRSRRLIGDATNEIVFVVGDEAVLTEELIESLAGVNDEVSLLIGGSDESLEQRIRNAVPQAETFVSGLEWLAGGGRNGYGEGRSVGRLLLIDRSAALVSTVGTTAHDEHAMFGAGAENGLVIITRRLLARDGPLTNRSTATDGSGTTDDGTDIGGGDGSDRGSGGTDIGGGDGSDSSAR